LQANLEAMHAKRVTINAKDIKLVGRIRGNHYNYQGSIADAADRAEAAAKAAKAAAAAAS
jgi:hypothetical protein